MAAALADAAPWCLIRWCALCFAAYHGCTHTAAVECPVLRAWRDLVENGGFYV
jgi:hypothetical protein